MEENEKEKQEDTIIEKDVKEDSKKSSDVQQSSSIAEDTANVKKETTKKGKNIKPIKVETNEKSKKGGFLKFTITFLAGLLLGTCIMFILYVLDIHYNITLPVGENIAKVDGSEIGFTTLYNKMKPQYGLNFLLEEVDSKILNSEYNFDDAMLSEIKSQADYYIAYYQAYYGYTQEQFLSENGFSSYDNFLETLKIDYLRNLCFEKYMATNYLKDSEIEDYYNNSVHGNIQTKHVLVKISDSVTDEQAKAKAEEIIVALQKGSTFDSIVTTYADSVTYEEFTCTDFAKEDSTSEINYLPYSNLEDSFVTGLLSLSEDNSYTTTPVKTSYGYHVIYRVSKTEKAKLQDVKEDIATILINNLYKSDSSLYNALYLDSLAKLRNKKGFTIYDEDLNSSYSEYLNTITTTLTSKATSNVTAE